MRTFTLLGMFLLVADVSLAANAASEATRKIVWEPDLQAAYRKALDTQKPMVVIFVANVDYVNAEGKNHSNDFLFEFADSALQTLGDRAVFVACEYDFKTGTVPVGDARKLFDELKIEYVPTLVVIDARTDALEEMHRIEGVQTAATIVNELSPYLLEEATQGHNVQQANFPPEPSPTLGAPETPSDAIHQLSQAVRAGDVDWLPVLFVKDYADLYRKVILASWRVGSAKRRLLAAMDQQFGVEDDTIPYGDDDQELREDLQKLGRIVLEQAWYPEPDVAAVQVRREVPNQPADTAVLRVVREDGAWRIEPQEWLGFTDRPRCQRYIESLDTLANDYFNLARRVLKGDIESREACKQMALELYRQTQSTMAQ